jgi:hypothetical protein
VVILRRRVKGSLAVEQKGEGQQALHFIDHGDDIKLWEYAVLAACRTFPG